MIAPGNGQRVDVGGARQDEETGAWSIWGIRLTMFLSVAIAVCLGWAWLETFYRHVAVNAQLSYGSFDPPLPNGIPLSVKVLPIIGNHYFGDFQLPRAYAAELRHGFSPYLELYRPEQYPPFAQVLFVPLTLLPLPAAAATYFLLSVGVLLVPLWLMLAPLKWEYRTIILTPVALVTTPFISLLDRGNDIGIAVGLIAWALWAWRSERWVLCGAFLAAAIALKAYPAALLVVPLALRRYRFTALVAGSAVLVNLLTLTAYPGGYMRNLRALVPALEGTSSPSTQLSSWSLYSVIPRTAGLLDGPSSVHHLLAPKGLVIWLPSILYVCGLYFVIWRGRVPQWCWGPLALASIQLVVPLSFVYTTAWAPLAAIWFAWGYLISTRAKTDTGGVPAESVSLRILVLLALVVTLAPSVFTISGSGGFETPLAQYLSPVLILVTLGTAIIFSFRPLAGNERSLARGQRAAHRVSTGAEQESRTIAVRHA